MSDDKGNKKPSAREAERLGMGEPIARRDFIGGALIGAGAALLSAAAPGAVQRAFAEESSKLPPVRGAGTSWSGVEIADDWQGPGGVGDYAQSNGNTGEVIRAGHAGVRNHDFEKKLSSAVDTNESYDVVIVGAGISGLFGAYDLLRQKPNAKVLLLENHAIFGGEAKQNQIDVDGYSLYGAQGPSVYLPTNPKPKDIRKLLSDELGLPQAAEYSEVTGMQKKLSVGRDYWTPQLLPDQVDVGYYYDSTGFVRNPHSNGFRDAPIDQKAKDDLAYILLNKKRPVEPEGDVGAWLDTMTYEQFLKKAYNAHLDAVKVCEDLSIVGGTGLGGDAYTASVGYYGVRPYSEHMSDMTGRWFQGMPTGNAGIARKLLKTFMPNAISGSTSMTDILFAKVNWDELDKQSNNARMRLKATVIGVKENSPAGATKSMTTYYLHGGKIYSVKSKAVLMATPQQVNRNICFDLPKEYVDAMGEFHSPPILKVSLAVRNWKFMEKADITAFKWWGDYPAYGLIERHMKIDGREVMPCDPSKPTMIPLYIPMCATTRGMPLAEQAIAARHILFALTYADIEGMVREQFTKMFSSYGFDAKRDIAGIVANRWGHAFVCPPPGFYYGKNGAPPVSDVISKPLDRMAFSHSDLSGAQAWYDAVSYARKGVEYLVTKI